MMRRFAVLALAAVAALPLAAGAQSTTDPAPGNVVFDGAIASDKRDTYINAKECAENGQLRITWEVALGGVMLPLGAQYQIYTSNQTGCVDPPVSPTETHQVTSTFPATSAQQTLLLPVVDFRTPWGIDCQTDKTMFVCVKVRGVSGTTIEDAEGSLQFQTQAPSPPTLAANQVTPADHSFDVDWDNVSGSPAADSYVVYATRVSNPAEVHRLEVRIETKGRVGGDLALDEYDVQVASVSIAGNEGEKSNAIRATPISVQDFWERYEGRGGVDDGGCATSGGTGLLAALAALLFLRRAGRSRP